MVKLINEGTNYSKKKDQKNPDFVFHVPGGMQGNTLVLEVKGRIEEENYQQGVVKDFENLILFVSKYGYYEGIFILYNYSYQQMETKFKSLFIEKFCENPQEINNKIVILTKEFYNSNTEIHTLNELIGQ